MFIDQDPPKRSKPEPGWHRIHFEAQTEEESEALGAILEFFIYGGQLAINTTRGLEHILDRKEWGQR